MSASRGRTSARRLSLLLVVLALLAAACTGDEPVDTTVEDERSPTTGAPPPETTAPGPGRGSATTPGTEPEENEGEFETYTMGIFEEITTDNPWNVYDVAGGSVYNYYVLDPTTSSAYTVGLPGLEVLPELAEGELEPAAQEGDVWVGEIILRSDAQWSDGVPITAQDLQFTWETAVEFELTFNWPDLTDADVVSSVEAVDDHTVEVTFDSEPGVAVWGLGNGVPFMPIMPEHHWGPIVEEARGTDDPRETLLAASGAGAPASGATVFEEWEEGSFAATSANENYFLTGEERTSGGVTYEVGPYADSFQYPIYRDQEQAVLALANGEVDLLLSLLGMEQGFREQVQENEELTAISNPPNSYRYLAFNHSRAPMSDAAFRDALTVLIDKEYVTEELLRGVAYPLYALLPEGNEPWYNEDVASQLAEEAGAGMGTDARRAEAIRILSEAGYGWEVTPGWSDAEGNVQSEPAQDLTFVGGEGLIHPDGSPVEQLQLIHPAPSNDPLRATFGGYIAGVARDIGIPMVSVPTDFNRMRMDMFRLDRDEQFESPFDMFILAFDLGNPAFPTFHCAFFCTGGTVNNTQYSNEEYDELGARLQSASTREEAYDIMWEMERIIARDKPHVPLFETGILEFYDSRLQYPFTDTLSGLQFGNGFPSLVTAR